MSGLCTDTEGSRYYFAGSPTLGSRYLGTYRALFMLANSEPRSDIIRAVLGRYTIVGKRKGESLEFHGCSVLPRCLSHGIQ